MTKKIPWPHGYSESKGMTEQYQEETILLNSLRLLIKHTDTRQIDMLISDQGADDRSGVWLRYSIAYTSYNHFYAQQNIDDGSDEMKMEDFFISGYLRESSLSYLQSHIHALMSGEESWKYENVYDTDHVNQGLRFKRDASKIRYPEGDDYEDIRNRTLHNERNDSYKLIETKHPGVTTVGDVVLVNDLYSLLFSIARDVSVINATIDNNLEALIIEDKEGKKTHLSLIQDNEQISQAIKNFCLKKDKIQDKYGCTIESRETDPQDFFKKKGENSFSLKKNLTYNPRPLIKAGKISREMFEFLIDAASAGVGIVISGRTNSGKTHLLKYLYHNLQDNKRSMIVNHANEHDNLPVNQQIIAIKGNISDIAHQAYRMRVERFIVDDFDGVGEDADMLSMLAHEGISILMTQGKDLTLPFKSAAQIYRDEIPFQIEVELADNGAIDEIREVKRTANGWVSNTQLWNEKHRESSEPTRSIRRAIQKHKDSIKIQNKAIANNGSKGNNDAHDLGIIVMTAEERMELRNAMKVIQKYAGRI